MIKLEALIDQANYSKMALATEAEIAYNIINHIAAGRTKCPKRSDANALLLVINRALAAQGKEEVRMEEVEEFVQVREGSNKLEKKPKGRPRGSLKRPASVAPMSASARFLIEVFGPQGHYEVKSRATELLDAVAREVSKLPASADAANRSQPTPTAAVVNLQLLDTANEASNETRKAGFTLIASQVAQLQNNAATATATRPGTLTVQVQIEKDGATLQAQELAQSQTKTNTSGLEEEPEQRTEEEAMAILELEATQSNTTSREEPPPQPPKQTQMRVWFRQYQEVVPPLFPGGDLALSWAEFEQLTLLQLKLLVDFYLAKLVQG
ncbi:MAG: hypothetical protein WCS37_18970 [Chloroflexota bacterium]|nr:hypothetical protein [Chloroflexota bacterium]